MLFTIFVCSPLIYGQLGFCTGSKGEPVFFENFGSGTNFGPALAPGITSYNYIGSDPNDGFYTLFHKTFFWNSWHNSDDHTPNNQVDGTNGKALLVNASFTAGEFYKRKVNGLCVNTTFEFTAWVMNVYNPTSNICAGTGIPVNIKFEIWDATETTLLKSGDTGAINGTPSAIWTQFGLNFTTLPGQTDIVLKMKNNGVGGCGNDLAIDDIMFRSCGDFATISTSGITGNSANICDSNLPINMPLSISVSGTQPHVFQWQESIDNTSWIDIIGQTNATLNVSNLITTDYFRVKVAQDIQNLSNPYCYTISDIFSIIVYPKPPPPTSLGDKFVCDNESFPALGVTPNSGTDVSWFDAALSGNLLLKNSNTYTPTAAGTYYAESYPPNTNCISFARTAVKLSILTSPILIDQQFDLCDGAKITLDADILNATYKWSTTEIAKTIEVSKPGIYSVIVTNLAGCTATKTITIIGHTVPKIETVVTNESTVTINPFQIGDYEFSLDGVNYQQSNIFENVIGGLKTAYIKEMNQCGIAKKDFILIITPLFFTPNNDGVNDYFEVLGLSLLSNASLNIFDRFGTFVTQLNGSNPRWDGTKSEKQLAATDYWYVLKLDNGVEKRGSFTLKR